MVPSQVVLQLIGFMPCFHCMVWRILLEYAKSSYIYLTEFAIYHLYCAYDHHEFSAIIELFLTTQLITLFFTR